MEIITGVGRRRYWSSEEKVRLVGEVAERGAAEVARRYEVCRSLLYRWRRQMRHGELAAVTAAAGLVPVRIAPEVPADARRRMSRRPPRRRPRVRLEAELRSGWSRSCSATGACCGLRSGSIRLSWHGWRRRWIADDHGSGGRVGRHDKLSPWRHEN
jgi:transposase-like protein